MAEHRSIGNVAEATGVRVVTIRYYEKIGLLPVPRRTASNYRVYSGKHIQRLRFIRRCRNLGFSLEQIKSLLELASKRTRACAQVDQMTREQLHDVEERIASLKRLSAELRHLSNCCSGNGVIADCRIIEALS